MFSNIILAAAALSVATAQAKQIPALAQRSFIEGRQDSDDGGLDDLDPACESALSSLLPIYSSAPTPPADLTLPDDPCVTPTFTGAQAAEWTSYTSAALDWFTSHSDEVYSLVTDCPVLAAQASGALTDIPVCSSIVGGADVTGSSSSSVPAQTTAPSDGGESSTSASAGVTGSGSGPGSGSTGPTTSHSGSSSPSSTGTPTPTPNAAPRETGFVVAAAALAAAGFMGAVAAL
jgi:hypothetical protein